MFGSILTRKIGPDPRAIKTNHRVTTVKDWRKEGLDSSCLWLVQAAPEVVQEVISSELEAILEGDTLAAYQARWLQQHSRTSLLHLAAAAEAGALLDPSKATASAQLILDGVLPCSDRSWLSVWAKFRVDCVLCRDSGSHSISADPSVSFVILALLQSRVGLSRIPIAYYCLPLVS